MTIFRLTQNLTTSTVKIETMIAVKSPPAPKLPIGKKVPLTDSPAFLATSAAILVGDIAAI